MYPISASVEFSVVGFVASSRCPKMPSVDDVWESMKNESRISVKKDDKKASKPSIDTQWLGTLSQSAGMISGGKETKVVETAELKVSVLDAKHIPGVPSALKAYSAVQGKRDFDDMNVVCVCVWPAGLCSCRACFEELGTPGRRTGR